MVDQVLEKLEYIDEIMQGVEHDCISLCIIELVNGEKLLTFIDNECIDNGNIEELLLPIHLVENYKENRVIYSLYPYSDMTNTISPIYIKDYVLYSFPSDVLIENYKKYWDGYILKLQELLKTGDNTFDLITHTKM